MHTGQLSFQVEYMELSDQMTLECTSFHLSLYELLTPVATRSLYLQCDWLILFFLDLLN